MGLKQDNTVFDGIDITIKIEESEKDKKLIDILKKRMR